MILTHLARRRWDQHFPNDDIAVQFLRARRPGKAIKQRLRRQLPSRVHEIGTFCGRYYLVAPCGAVFVVAPPEVVVTTFPLTGDTSWRMMR